MLPPNTDLCRVVITGPPGAGKTTLLSELARRGHAIVEETARTVICERLARSEPPRPNPLSFALEILRRDEEKFHRVRPSAEWVFFDRSAVEALGMVHEASPLPAAELESRLSALRYHSEVFVLPPWEEIYVNDAERDQTFAEAIRVHGEIVAWYCACGYLTHEVPGMPVDQRADYVLRRLRGDGL